MLMCRQCQPNRFPRKFPIRNGHASVQYDLELATRTIAYLDFVDVSAVCDEVIPGKENGLVVMFDRSLDGDILACACGLGPAMRVELGNVYTEIVLKRFVG